MNAEYAVWSSHKWIHTKIVFNFIDRLFKQHIVRRFAAIIFFKTSFGGFKASKFVYYQMKKKTLLSMSTLRMQFMAFHFFQILKKNKLLHFFKGETAAKICSI